MTQITVSEALKFAVQEHQANRLDRAEQVYRKILETQPEQPDALRGLGILAWQVGKYELAEKLIRGALKVQPHSAERWCDLGDFLQNKSQFLEAVTSYQKALEIQPNLISAHQKLGYTLQQMGEFDRASSCFHKAMEVQHSSVEVLQRSPYENIYHCCVQKTASQWFRAIFNDRIFYQYTGLLTCPYTQAGLKDARFDRAWPTQTIAAHLYDKHQFKRYSQGRDRGKEDINSHYRKGESGDWRNYFNESIMAYFKQVTKDSIGRLNYPE